MTKPVSCGFIIIDTKNEKILMVHPTNQDFYWDFPKGKKEENETEYEAAIRELEEETSITINNNDCVFELGLHKYNKYKDIYLFSCLDKEFDVENLFCRSMVESDPPFPECDNFKMFTIEEAKDVMAPSMKKVFVYEIEPFIKKQIKDNKR